MTLTCPSPGGKHANLEEPPQQSNQPRDTRTDASSQSIPFARCSRVPMMPLAPLDVGQRPSTPSHRRQSSGLPSSPCSTRLHSSSSQIFERDVQEDIHHVQPSPSIPSHLRTENHIPPVLGASSVVLTDDKLDPDSIEIVTHNLHHAAASSLAHTDDLMLPSSHDDVTSIPPIDNDDSVSLSDHPDVRRLSFVSFADVVHGEHAGMEAIPSGELISESGFNNSHSFIRHTKSSHFNIPSSPSDASMSPKAMSPARSLHSRGCMSPVGSARSAHLHGSSGDLSVETMRQALRRSESQDFGAFRSHPTNAI